MFQDSKFIGLVAVDTYLKDYFDPSDILTHEELSYLFAVNDEGDSCLL